MNVDAISNCAALECLHDCELVSLGQHHRALHDLGRLRSRRERLRFAGGPGQQGGFAHDYTTTSIRPSCERNRAALSDVPT